MLHVDPATVTGPKPVEIGKPSESLAALIGAHELAYAHALVADTYGEPDVAARKQAEEEAFRALLHTPLHSDADRAAYAIAVLERQSSVLVVERSLGRNHPMPVAYRNLRFGEYAREESAREVATVAVQGSATEDVPAPAAPHADPHLALLPALRQAYAWTRDAQPIINESKYASPEYKSANATLDYCWHLADRILALPAPTTPAGLGAVALAITVWTEGFIGLDPEIYNEERRIASAIRAMMSVAGVTQLPEWSGFGDEPDSRARWDAMMTRAGEGSLPVWALAGKSGPDEEEIATSEEAALAAAPVPAHPPVSDLARACIEQVESMVQWHQRDKSVGLSDEDLDAELDAWGAALRRAIGEPSSNLVDLAAKARLLLTDMENFRPEEKRTNDDERLMLVILREAMSLAGQGAPTLPPLHPATAWISLPSATRDTLGTTLVDLVFQDFLSGVAYAEEDRVLTDDAQRSAAIERAERLLNRIYDDVAAALPALFGPAGENPAWVDDYRAGRLSISNEGVLS